MTVRDLVILGTSSQQPTRHRNHGAYLFRWCNEGMLFDPGEGTQRQFIFAGVSPTVITRIFISHFHGDHCLGLGSVLMRLNLDKITRDIRCYFPASGARYFHRLVKSTSCNLNVNIIEIPVSEDGIIDDFGDFIVEAAFLDHGIDCIGWKVSEKNVRKFDEATINRFKLKGRDVRDIINFGSKVVEGKNIKLSDISTEVAGDSISVVLDTKMCKGAEKISKSAGLLLCESTYLSDEKDVATKNKHMTAVDAANLAKKSNVQVLVLTHFSARHLRESVFQEEAAKIFSNVIAAKDFMRIKIPKSR